MQDIYIHAWPHNSAKLNKIAKIIYLRNLIIMSHKSGLDVILNRAQRPQEEAKGVKKEQPNPFIL